MIRKGTLGVSLLMLVLGASAAKPAFEVASIKPNTSGMAGGSIGPRGDGLFATNVTLKSLLMYAYTPPKGQLLRMQIIGGPNWIDTDHFDIQAKLIDSAGVPPIAETRMMLQSLLEDRFQLKAHRETRELPVYNLVIFKGGPKLAADQTPPDPRQGFITFASAGEPLSPLPRGAVRVVSGPGVTTITGSAIRISMVVNLLQGRSDRIVIDKTGFEGLLDMQMEFSQDDPAAAPSLFTAIQDLGLKLESAKTPLEVVVIDGVQKPSEN